MLLVIGNKNYSSWSLRSWIALKMLGVPVDKKRIALRRPETKAEILRYSSAGRVPILRDGDTVVWGSLAILEYLAEKRPQLWPSDPAQRAKARSVAAVRRDPRERAACLTTLAECPLLADCCRMARPAGVDPGQPLVPGNGDYFAAAGKAGSLPMSRRSCWMITVALRFAAIFFIRSIDATVCARS